jgi:ABC-type methionine transport system ATPase subunit
MFPPKLIKEPLIWKLGQKFKVVTNIRQASVTDEIGIVCLELDGNRDEVKAAIAWLEKLGVSVEPVEISVIES